MDRTPHAGAPADLATGTTDTGAAGGRRLQHHTGDDPPGRTGGFPESSTAAAMLSAQIQNLGSGPNQKSIT